MNNWCNLDVEVLEDRLLVYSLAGAWDIVNLTFSYVGDNHPTEVRSAILAALSLWSAAAPLHFTEVIDTGISGGVRDDYPHENHPHIRLHFDVHSVSGLALAYYPAGFSGVDGLSGDIFFAPGSRGRLEQIATHEIGHSLGLGHSSISRSIMAVSIDRSVVGQLHEDDIAGIQYLYGVGSGSVTIIESIEPLNTLVVHGMVPEIPFMGFSGQIDRAGVYLNDDGILDAVFVAQGEQGHVKVFDGASGNEIISLLVFPGFFGRVKLAANENVFAIAAQEAQGHVKVFWPDGMHSVLAFPSYRGEVSLVVNSDGVQVSATVPSGRHTKVFDMGQEVLSQFDN